MGLKYQTILIQGALDIEIEYLIAQLLIKEKKIIAGYEFYIGTINNRKIIISKTLVGVVNATTATTIGITSFNPDIVINQGIAGAHKKDIHIGDIIVGRNCCNINSYSMPTKNKGDGSNSMEWELNERAKEIKTANIEVVNSVHSFFKSNYNKPVYVGILGSGDIFNREIDRINWINNIFNNLCEDMESIGVYSVCNNFNIPCIGIRIISNNEITSEKLDKKQAVYLQEILVKFLK